MIINQIYCFISGRIIAATAVSPHHRDMPPRKLLVVSLLASTTLFATARIASATCDVTTFGATGNGTTDDRVAIQNAINSCSSSGDNDVYFPSGTYSLTQAGTAFYN